MALIINKDKLKKWTEPVKFEKSHTILIVDDEPANITSLQIALDGSYNIIIANDGLEALEVVKNHPSPQDIHLILTDQRMPRMNGVEFLREVIPLVPDSIRMILTGYTDLNVIIEAINDGQIYKFLTKPIEPRDLQLSIQRALEAYDLQQQNKSLINELKKLNLSLEAKVETRTKDLQSTLTHLEQVNAVTLAVMSQSDLQSSARTFIEEVVKILRPEGSGSILLYNETRNVLVFYASYGLDPQYVKNYEVQVTPETLYTFDVFSKQNRRIYHQRELKPYINENLKRLHFGRVFEEQMVVPLVSDGKSIGLVSLSHYTPEMPFSDSDARMIETIGMNLSHHFEHTRLFDELRNTQTQLQYAEQLASLTKTFQKFVPIQFLNRIAKEGLQNITLGHAETDVLSMLFCDIRSFTTLSEKLNPQELLNFLNSYFMRMNAPIHQNHGFIDKFIGDGILALFDHKDGSPSVRAKDAVMAAIGMQEALMEYNSHRAQTGYNRIVSGVGVHTGPVVIGTIGSQDRMDSTVLGDAVNLTARLEGLTKYYGCSVLTSGETLDLVKDDPHFLWREIDLVGVKGRLAPVRIYEIFNAAEKSNSNKKLALRDAFHGALRFYEQQEWKSALESFQQCLQIEPSDTPSQIYIERCQQYIANPPTHWNRATHYDWK